MKISWPVVMINGNGLHRALPKVHILDPNVIGLGNLEKVYGIL